MCFRSLILGLGLALAGCTSSADRDKAAEARGYERGYREAVKEQYWIIQNQQRGPSAPAAPAAHDSLKPHQP